MYITSVSRPPHSGADGRRYALNGPFAYTPRRSGCPAGGFLLYRRAQCTKMRRRSTYSAQAANDIMVDLLPNLTWRLSTAVLTEADVLADGGSPEQIAASGCVTQQETNGDGYEYYACAMSVENADDEVIWIICSWAVLPL